mmetsp:Transcript_45022/g.131096  ORF Transcript_45022/g.131096 Transcript_45022/m.131096 type:complete len:757 (+) Transcript_45022:58-2328(+)
MKSSMALVMCLFAALAEEGAAFLITDRDAMLLQVATARRHVLAVGSSEQLDMAQCKHCAAAFFTAGRCAELSGPGGASLHDMLAGLGLTPCRDCSDEILDRCQGASGGPRDDDAEHRCEECLEEHLNAARHCQPLAARLASIADLLQSPDLAACSMCGAEIQQHCVALALPHSSNTGAAKDGDDDDGNDEDDEDELETEEEEDMEGDSEEHGDVDCDSCAGRFQDLGLCNPLVGDAVTLEELLHAHNLVDCAACAAKIQARCSAGATGADGSASATAAVDFGSDTTAVQVTRTRRSSTGSGAGDSDQTWECDRCTVAFQDAGLCAPLVGDGATLEELLEGQPFASCAQCAPKILERCAIGAERTVPGAEPTTTSNGQDSESADAATSTQSASATGAEGGAMTTRGDDDVDGATIKTSLVTTSSSDIALPPEASSGVSCSECAVVFSREGGCQAMEDMDTGFFEQLLQNPDFAGCAPGGCSAEFKSACFTGPAVAPEHPSCEWCAEAFDAAGGCEALALSSHFAGGRIPGDIGAVFAGLSIGRVELHACDPRRCREELSKTCPRADYAVKEDSNADQMDCTVCLHAAESVGLCDQARIANPASASLTLPEPCVVLGQKCAVKLSEQCFGGDGEGCDTTEEGDSCFEEVQWAMKIGFRRRGGAYPGLSETSSFEDFQEQLSDLKPSRCPKPCPVMPLACHTATPEDECHKHVVWAMQEVAHGNWHDYPSQLKADSTFEDYQAWLHRIHHGDCPAPCAA